MEDLVKIFAALLTIFACLLGLYEKYGATFTFEVFLFVMIALLLIIKLLRISKQRLKDVTTTSDQTVPFPSSHQEVSIKSTFSDVKTGDINQSFEINKEDTK